MVALSAPRRRLEALEAAAPRVLTLVTEVMPVGADPAPYEAAALAEWRHNTGAEPPMDVLFTHFILRGVKPDRLEANSDA